MTRIHLSPAAVAEVNRIKSKHPNPEALFRLGIQSGGCADWYYTLELDEAIEAQDQVVTCDGIQLVMNTDTAKYLDGLHLDYTEDLMGGGFRFNNPNAANSCGCGNSFSVKPD